MKKVIIDLVGGSLPIALAIVASQSENYIILAGTTLMIPPYMLGLRTFRS